jgi:hypothetical protein
LYWVLGFVKSTRFFKFLVIICCIGFACLFKVVFFFVPGFYIVSYCFKECKYGGWNLKLGTCKKEFNPLEVNIDKMPYVFYSLDCLLLILIYVRFGVCNKFRLKVKRIHI